MGTALIFSVGGALVGASGPVLARESTSERDAKFLEKVNKPTKSELKKQLEDEANERREAENLDKLFPVALSEGKAIVIIPIAELNPLNIVRDMGNGLDVEAKDLVGLVRRTRVVWTNSEGPDNKLHVGAARYYKSDGANGFFLELDIGRYAYLIYIVEPGRYSMSDVYYQIPRTTAPVPSNGVKDSNRNVGQIVLEEFPHTDGEEYYQQWEPEETQSVFSHNECAVQVMSGPGAGSCVQQRAVYVNQVIKQAGYYTRSRVKYSTGLDVGISLNKGFASFAVAAGEAVVVDGLFPEPPNAVYNNSECHSIAADKVTCAVRELGLTYLQASSTDVQKFQGHVAEVGQPELAKILSTVKYRPIEWQAQRAARTGNYGPIYYISSQ